MKSFLRSFWAFILLFFIPFISLNAQVLQDSIYTKKEIIEDLTFLKEALQAVHPALYEFQTEAEFNTLFEKAIHQVKEEMTDWDMLNLMGSIAQAIGCGHTTVAKVNTKREVKLMKKRKIFSLDTVSFLPFKGAFIENRLFTGASYDTTLDKKTEILSIDGHSLKEILEKVRSYPVVSNDGMSKRLLNFYARYEILEHVYRYYFPIQSSIRLEVKKATEVSYLKIPTFAHDDPKMVVATKPKYEPTIWGKKDSFKNRAIHIFQHKNQKELCLLEIPAFKPKTRKRLSKVFEYLANNQTKELIIDLRGNLGGQVAAVTNLLSYLLNEEHTFVTKGRKLPSIIKKSRYKEFFLAPFIRSIFVTSYYKKRRINGEKVLSKTIKPKNKHHYKGNLYILTDGGSFSGSSLFAGIIKSEKRATFLGTETGGAKDVTNGAIYFYPKLPNSRCSIRIPRYRIDHHTKNPNKGRGVIPDYIVPTTVESYLSGEDLVLEKVLEVIKKKE